MARPRECRARVLAQRAPAPDIVEADLRMEEPQALAFEAGQWVSVPFGPKIVRAYTIASPPYSSRIITLCADVAPGGLGSAWFRALAPGAEVVFKGPLGGFVFARADPRRPLFVAEEIGIVPIRSMLTHLYATGLGRATTLVYGAGPSPLYDREFTSLARRYPRFSYHPVPVAGLASAVESLVDAVDGLVAYVAGGEATIHRVREVLLAKGLERRAVKWEKFW
jgi:3-phenylpropionate/trans-cinnamate dioxygenase ferredoxin reductase subunit